MKRFLKGIIAGVGAALLLETALVILSIAFGMSFQQAVLTGLLTIGIILFLVITTIGIVLFIEWAND